MSRFTPGFLVAGILGAAVFLGPAAASTGRLEGQVGPSFKIEVERAATRKTTVAYKGEQTWTIKLKPGRYTYQCDPHAATGMKGHFKVTR